ncbi:MAG: CynX/NimT family MFS transporter [Sciscionella sp.]
MSVQARDRVARQSPLTGTALLTVAVLLVAANLRPAVTSLGSVLEEVRGSLGASTVLASLLTALPPVCFGLAGLAAPVITRRLGMARAVGFAVAVLAAGIAVRVAGGEAVMLLGTFVACGGIAVCNVLIPVVIKQSYPARIGVLTGLYTASLQSAAALGSALTPPLDDALGGWRPALGAWVSVALLALLCWAAASYHGARRPTDTDVPERGPAERKPRGVRSMLRTPLAWQITGYFGLQSFFAYVIMGWLPEVLVDAGVSRATAGVLLGVISLLGVPISLLIAPLAARQHSQVWWAAGLPALSLLGTLGLLFAPAAAPLLWSLLVGAGMGSFAIAVALISLRSATADTQALSTMTQSVGYLIAALGPLAFGVLHGITGDWTVSFVLVLAVITTQCLLGVFAGRPRHV